MVVRGRCARVGVLLVGVPRDAAFAAPGTRRILRNASAAPRPGTRSPASTRRSSLSTDGGPCLPDRASPIATTTSGRAARGGRGGGERRLEPAGPTGRSLGSFADPAAFNSDIAFQGHTPSPATSTASPIFDISNPHQPRSSARCCARARRTTSPSTANLLFLSTDSPAPTTRAPARRSPRRSRSRGRASRSSTSATRRNPRYIKSIETNCGSHTHTLVPGNDGRRLPLRLVLLPGRDVPGLPAAARPDLDHQGAAAAADRGARGRHAQPVPGRRQPGGRRPRRPPAATTSPPTRPRTSPPARAWATAS